MMKATEQTIQQINRALRKTAEKFSPTEEATKMTDIHIRVNQETGELMTFDDDDRELTRCVVEQWIGNTDEDFYDAAADSVKQCVLGLKEVLDDLSVIKPYSFVLEDEEGEAVAELYVADDDIAIIDPLSIDTLDDDLDDFLDHLLKS